MLPTVWRQVRPEGPRTRLKPHDAWGWTSRPTTGGFHRTDADRSLREVGCQDLPLFTSEFRFCRGLSYFMLDFMERNASDVPSTATPRVYRQIERRFTQRTAREHPIIGSSMGGCRRGAGHVLFLAGSNDRQARMVAALSSPRLGGRRTGRSVNRSS